MTAMRRTALAAITILVAAATSASFAESYRALLEWASHHGLHGVWAVAWPLQVDVFVAVGELALFVALADSWTVRQRAAAWTVTLIGLAVSVAGNVGHIDGGGWTSRLTASIPPLAAAAALAVGLGVLKRVVARRESVPPRDMSADRDSTMSRAPLGTGIQTGSQTPAGTGSTAVSGPVRPALPGPVPDDPDEPVPADDRKPVRRTRPNRSGKRTANRSRTATGEDAETEFAAEIAAGMVPTLYQIRTRLHVGNERAKVLRQHIARQALTTT